jgi:hypothetical protein
LDFWSEEKPSGNPVQQRNEKMWQQLRELARTVMPGSLLMMTRIQSYERELQRQRCKNLHHSRIVRFTIKNIFFFYSEKRFS